MRGMGAFPKPTVSVEDYLEMDRGSEIPLEYHDGEVFPIAIGSLWHGLIGANLAGTLRITLKGGDCRVSAPTRVRTRKKKYVYPDLFVLCGDPRFTPDGETLENPTVVIEILSPSTKNYDYGEKFEEYRLLASLRDYVLVAQDKPKVEVYHLLADGDWRLSSYAGLEASAVIESICVSLPLAEVYEGVAFPPVLEEVPS